MLGFGALGELALGQVATDDKALSVDVGAFVIAGQDVGLYATRYLTAETGVFTLTFNSAELARGRLGLSVTSGGGVRGLRASSGGGVRGLNASAGGGGKGLRIRA